MHKNPAWIVFLSVITLLTLWYTADALSKWNQYRQLDERTLASEVQWSIRKTSNTRFVPHVRFHYTVNNTAYKGESTLKYYAKRNSWAAEELIREIADDEPLIWYSSHQPERAVFDKHFPTSEIISSFALIALLCYFAWLGVYVVKIKQ